LSIVGYFGLVSIFWPSIGTGFPTREVMEALPLEALENHVDVAMRDVVSWHSGDGHGFMVRLDDLRGLFQP